MIGNFGSKVEKNTPLTEVIIIFIRKTLVQDIILILILLLTKITNKQFLVKKVITFNLNYKEMCLKIINKQCQIWDITMLKISLLKIIWVKTWKFKRKHHLWVNNKDSKKKQFHNKRKMMNPRISHNLVSLLINIQTKKNKQNVLLTLK